MTCKLIGLALTTACFLTACNSDSSTNEKPSIEQPAEPIIYGPYSTGSVSAPVSQYFDLETMNLLTLTDEEASENQQWDIAFRRSSIRLNNASTTQPVSMFFTGNNADFFDQDGQPVAEQFIAATPDSELDDFIAITTAEIPSDDSFIADESNQILAGFYHYDSVTHQVSAASEHRYIVASDDTFSRFYVKDIVTAGRAIGQLTISFVNQTSTDTAFATTEQQLDVDVAMACSGFAGVYIDFATGEIVSESDAWDISLSCNADNTGADFALNLANDATALQDFQQQVDAIDPAALRYYGFQPNNYHIQAFDQHPWYQYGLNGGHALWSQYGVYLIKTSTAVYKFQMLSYYNESGESGNISFRAEAL